LGGDVDATRIVEHHLSLLELVGPRVPVSFEVVSSTYEGMVAEGIRLHSLFSEHGNVVVKVPSNPSMDYDSPDSNDLDGLRATAELTRRGIKVNNTLVFKPEQAILCALVGASYVSPFIGRLDHRMRNLQNPTVKHERDAYFPRGGLAGIDDNGVVSGIGLTYLIVKYLKRVGSQTEVLGASLRNATSVAETGAVGAHLATVPLGPLEEWAMHEQQDLGRLEIPQPRRERQLDGFVTEVTGLGPHEDDFIGRLADYFAGNPYPLNRYLRHPQTLDGMEKFTADTVPAYREMLSTTTSA
jgi:transaldolase